MEINEIGPILSELKQVVKSKKMRVSDDLLFDVSVRIFNSRNIEEQKQKSKNGSASERQLNFICKLKEEGKIDKTLITEKLTVEKASAIISEAVKPK